MRFVNRPLLLLLGMIALIAVPARLLADVKDNAKIFSQDAVDKANSAISDIQRRHGKQFVLETFPTIPADQKDQLQQKGNDLFFRDWMAGRAKELQVNGVYALVCMNPKYIEVGAGAQTRARGDFTASDIGRLRQTLQTSFHNQQYDQGLLQAVDAVDRAFTANIHGDTNRSVAPVNQPAYPGTPFPSHHSSQTGFGGLICLGIGAIAIISLISSIFRRRTGGGYGGGAGGYGGGYGGGGYPQQGYGGGGGGFGRGLLGGLLGGVLGGYAADRWDHRNDQSGGGMSSGGGFGGGGGGGFDSGPSDAGQGFGDSSSGGDFSGGGGGGGGGDSGGGF